MSRASTSRLLATGISRVSAPTTATRSIAQPWARAISQLPSQRAPNDPTQNKPAPPSGRSAMDELAQATSRIALETVAKARNTAPPSFGEGGLAEQVGLETETETQPYHFHIYAHKHNTHVTVTKPNRDAIISVSCGNLGFKKSNRKHYDSAYQLGAYVIDKLHQGGWHKKIKSLEVVLRGYGQGREAVTKILLGSQGALLRNSIIRVADATRLKFGGTRSPKPRRLG
ncbi:hypothetical protein GE09DRAFT_454928 [Coniochaeta sp. 2T2.1]|nr:hypothetical protein GE09DRAFT_454928 [Coniochaeta sp. 2T2.1]